MDFYEEHSKDQLEKEAYEKTYQKQMKLIKLILTIVFTIIGITFVVLGICMILFPMGDPDAVIVGYVFTPFGALFIIVVILISILIKPNNVKGAYDRYKKRVNKYGYTNVYDLNIKIQLLENRIEELERRLK